MRTIPGLKRLRAVTGKEGFQGFSHVQSLTFAEEEQGYSLVLVLENETPLAKVQIAMKFTCVIDVRLRDFGGKPTQITGFDVRDVSSRQLDGIRFEVVDYENDRIHFFCKSAEIELVERIQC
jgi:hypothetical protein